LHLLNNQNKESFLKLLIRQNELNNIFCDQNQLNLATINLNNSTTIIDLVNNKLEVEEKNNKIFDVRPYYFSFKNVKNRILDKNDSELTFYTQLFKNKSIGLDIPSGHRIIDIIKIYKELRELISQYFSYYNLEFLIDSKTRTIEIQKKQDGIVYKTPYELIAETLQRIIFYMAAIISNQDAVLLFEEPEVHLYPPYIKELADKILESKTNQFFIATHNPLLLQTLLGNDFDKEVNLFLVDYKDHQTVIRKITDDEVDEILQYGIDIFFNERWFTYEEESEKL